MQADAFPELTDEDEDEVASNMLFEHAAEADMEAEAKHADTYVAAGDGLPALPNLFQDEETQESEDEAPSAQRIKLEDERPLELV